MTKKEFNEMIYRDNRKLFVLAYRMVRNRQEAEDIVQNVFIKLWGMKDELDKIKNLHFLAVSMTRNASIDVLRRWKFYDPNKDELVGEKQDKVASPYDLLVDKEEEGIIMDIVRDLPYPYKEILIMREIEGLSYMEIANIKEININTLRVTVSRARKMVKEKFYEYETRKN